MKSLHHRFNDGNFDHFLKISGRGREEGAGAAGKGNRIGQKTMSFAGLKSCLQRILNISYIIDTAASTVNILFFITNSRLS